ncbi:MAG: PBP1A family penicillin-binding protein [Spirochaetia bacterium]|nr:PBP1A family penicillin-binding protein [Spirochaetota bacterium]MCX8096936.1 PBP1A family penicillin-binding protein [Spirochaetota bacterium]MDW8112423.1 PBP1A family penicillin-binding protein [Spirochaetia bacterium]
MIRRIVSLFLPNITLKKLVVFIVISFVIFSIFSGVFFGILIISLYNPDDVKNLRYLAIPEPTRVYDRNGRLISELFVERRIPVSFNQISRNVINAFIAVEDEDFFYHRGISIPRIVKAMIKNILSGRIREGASTITQQLAKRIYTSGDRNIFRKIVEMWYALQIEKEYSKQEIMEIYLNQIYFGYGAYGVETASRIYFGKSVSSLDVAEAALLAAIPKGPHLYSPFVNVPNAQKRQYLVLKRMASLGFVSESEVDRLYSEFWSKYLPRVDTLKLNVVNNQQVAPFFVEYVRQVIAKMFGDEAVYKSGYRVYTTIDLDKQIAAEKYVLKYRDIAQRGYEEITSQAIRANQHYVDLIWSISELIPILKVKTSSRIMETKKSLKDLYYITFLISEMYGSEKIRANSQSLFLSISETKVKENRIECALVSIDSKNGYVEAMVGGSEFSPLNRFNRAIQAKRQLGSTFKPFLYSAGIDAKLITSATAFVDEPIEYRFAGRVWSPKNYEGDYVGQVTLRDALRLSLNIVSVKVLDRIGLGILRNYTKKFFDLSDEDTVKFVSSMASALGIVEVSPLELAVATTVFPRGGTRVQPVMILRIEDKYGRVVRDLTKEIDRSPVQVISPQTAFIVTSMMRDAVNRGTGAMVRSVGFYGDVAGKTGTTSYWRDAWFIGFTGDGLVTAIWYGFDKSTISMGRGMVGGRIAAPAFGEYMRDIYRNRTVPSIDIPYQSGISSAEICEESGKLATPLCNKVRVEYFLTGTEPTDKCDIHLKDYAKTKDEDILKFEEKKDKDFLKSDDFSDFRDDYLKF